MPRKCYYVYILASLTGTLYVGSTDNLIGRMYEHKTGVFKGFTKKYKIDRLMYFEVLTDGKAAASREQQLRKFSRKRKIALIEIDNPKWKGSERGNYKSICAVNRDFSLRSKCKTTRMLGM